MENFDFVGLSANFGLIATGLFTANLLLGVLLSTKYQRTSVWQRMPRFVRRISLYQVHSYTAYIALLTAFTHPVLLLFDKKAGFSLLNIAVPITAPHQSYVYTLGALAFYGLLTAVITSTVFVRKLFTNRTWKLIHYISYGAAMLFLIHGIWADPLLLDRPVNFIDAEKVLSEGCLLLVVGALIYRLRYARQKRESETFYQLKVSEIIRETDAASTFILEVPEHLKKQFKYQPGQFITLRVHEKTPNGDSFVKRSYSMTSAPETDERLAIAIKRLGPISNYLLNTVKAGDELMVLPPEGSFFLKPTKKRTHYLFFAAGSGITPFMSMTKSLLKTGADNPISLVYANVDEKSIIFKDELEKLASENRQKFSVFHVLESPKNDWTGRRGMLVAETLNELIDEILKNRSASPEYYVCGPVGYINLVQGVLLSRNAPAEKIHAERFTFSPNVDVLDGDETTGTGLLVGEVTEWANGNPPKLKIQLNGKIEDIDYRKGVSVLDAALRAGLLPPFACQQGACSSCKAKVVRGRVWMLKHEALTSLEADQRSILTCTAVAVSAEVVISFDE